MASGLEIGEPGVIKNKEERIKVCLAQAARIINVLLLLILEKLTMQSLPLAVMVTKKTVLPRPVLMIPALVVPIPMRVGSCTLLL